jgi:hypothetical protein
MSIEPNEPPPALVAVLKRTLVPAAPFWGETSSAAKAPKRFLSFPHRAAYLRLDEIRADADLRAIARPQVWRFLVQQAKQSADVPDDAAGTAGASVLVGAATADAVTNEFTGMNHGPHVAGTEAAIRFAETCDNVRDGRFEAIFLMVPAVHVAALWLKDKIDSADIVIFIEPTNSQLVANQQMDAASFLKVLSGLAEKVRAR